MFVLIAFLIQIGYVLLAISLQMAFLALLDRRIAKMKNAHFNAVMGIIHGDARATAIYYGFRFAGVCIIAAALVRG